MNRLIIIGNGFDLAHGLPTSYRHFINDFWMKITTHYKTDDYKELIQINEFYTVFFNFESNRIIDFNSFLINLHKYSEEYNYRMNIKNHIYYADSMNKIIFKFKSDFFKQICIKDLTKWVDIETEYYKNLINIAKSEQFSETEKSQKVITLNQQFRLIKKLLFQYLKEEICDNYDYHLDDSNKIINYFKSEIDDINNSSLNSFSNLFLSFNYTPTARLYSDFLKGKLYNSNVNYIHGEIGDEDNSEIIFGYGDDKDENYKLIKNFNNNDFLENIKPFEYKNNDNFENLLGFLNQSKFIVYLVGHSCGLSDKYLLNHILEHENCNSIKALYRMYDDGTDDFKNKPRDISRHFDNDRLSTIRMVNKKKSYNIPQDIRFSEIKTKEDYEMF